jgi:hypothetical protein
MNEAGKKIVEEIFQLHRKSNLNIGLAESENEATRMFLNMLLKAAKADMVVTSLERQQEFDLLEKINQIR